MARPRLTDPVPGLVVTPVLVPGDEGLPEWYEPMRVEAFMTPGTGQLLITAGEVRDYWALIAYTYVTCAGHSPECHVDSLSCSSLL